MHSSHTPAPQPEENSTPQPGSAGEFPPPAPAPLPTIAPRTELDPETDPRLAPDLRSPLHFVDLAALAGFYLIVGVLINVALVIAARYLLGISAARLENSNTTKSLVILLSQSLLSGATLVFLYGLVRSRTASPFWPAVGWRRLPGDMPAFAAAVEFLFAGTVLAVVTGWASRFLDRDVVLPMEELLRSPQSVLLLMGLGVLVAPAVEETIFRGCIYPILARRLGVGTSIVLTGLLFGLAHGPQLWPGYGQIALLIFVGIVLTYIRARTGTVAASYLVHLGYNSLLFAGFFWSTGGLRHLPS